MLHMSAMLCCVYARVSIQQLTCSCYRWIDRGGGGVPGTSRVLESSARPKRSVRVRAGSGHAGNGCEQVAPTIGIWVAACFPGGTASGEAQIRALVEEAADAARSDYGVEAALAWVDGYVFPPEAVQRDTACLESAGWDFEVMVAALRDISI
jgi:hypothetical protein